MGVVELGVCAPSIARTISLCSAMDNTLSRPGLRHLDISFLARPRPDNYN